ARRSMSARAFQNRLRFSEICPEPDTLKLLTVRSAGIKGPACAARSSNAAVHQERIEGEASVSDTHLQLETIMRTTETIAKARRTLIGAAVAAAAMLAANTAAAASPPLVLQEMGSLSAGGRTICAE